MTQQTQNKAALYLFPVPMGDNLPEQVLPAQNIEIVRNVKHFVVENLRSARRFLKACDRNIDIDSLTFAELSEHTRNADFDAMLAPIAKGESVGVISEAGCPAVADPGADIVAAAQRKGIRVIPLVGPSSIIMSVMASGFNGQSFAFNGYLPIDTGARMAKVKEMERRIAREHQTQIFIETPYRNNKMIQWLCSALPGDMMLCVAAGITTEHEKILTMPVSKWKTCNYNYDKIPAIFLIYRN